MKKWLTIFLAMCLLPGVSAVAEGIWTEENQNLTIVTPQDKAQVYADVSFWFAEETKNREYRVQKVPAAKQENEKWLYNYDFENYAITFVADENHPEVSYSVHYSDEGREILIEHEPPIMDNYTDNANTSSTSPVELNTLSAHFFLTAFVPREMQGSEFIRCYDIYANTSQSREVKPALANNSYSLVLLTDQAFSTDRYMLPANTYIHMLYWVETNRIERVHIYMPYAISRIAETTSETQEAEVRAATMAEATPAPAASPQPTAGAPEDMAELATIAEAEGLVIEDLIPAISDEMKALVRADIRFWYGEDVAARGYRINRKGVYVNNKLTFDQDVFEISDSDGKVKYIIEYEGEGKFFRIRNEDVDWSNQRDTSMASEEEIYNETNTAMYAIMNQSIKAPGSIRYMRYSDDGFYTNTPPTSSVSLLTNHDIVFDEYLLPAHTWVNYQYHYAYDRVTTIGVDMPYAAERE